MLNYFVCKCVFDYAIYGAINFKNLVSALEKRKKILGRIMYSAHCEVVICHLHCNETLKDFGYLNLDSLNILLDKDCRYEEFVQNGNCLNFIRESLELPINKTSRLLTYGNFCSY